MPQADAAGSTQETSPFPFMQYMACKVCLILALITITSLASPFAIEHIIIAEPVKSRYARGVALGPYGGAMEGVRARVFDKPEYLFDQKTPWVEAEKLRHKLADQITKADGLFHFNLRPGKYEIRLTRDEQLYDPLSYVLIVAKGSPKQGACVYMKPESGAGGRVEICDIAHPPEKK
jgi:hypothetical protein